MFRNRARALAESYRRAAGLHPEDGIVVVPGPAIEAYALPGLPGRIVVSGRLLDCLDDRRRAALIAHEQAHLASRHHLFSAVARLAAAANPLLIPVARAVDYTVERWADEHAAAVTSDRRLVAQTIGQVALLAGTGRRRVAGMALGVTRTPRPAGLAGLGRAGAPPGRRPAHRAAAAPDHPPRRVHGHRADRRGGRPARRPGPARPARTGPGPPLPVARPRVPLPWRRPGGPSRWRRPGGPAPGGGGPGLPSRSGRPPLAAAGPLRPAPPPATPGDPRQPRQPPTTPGNPRPPPATPGDSRRLPATPATPGHPGDPGAGVQARRIRRTCSFRTCF